MECWSELHLSVLCPSFADTVADAAASDETRRIYDCETCKHKHNVNISDLKMLTFHTHTTFKEKNK